MLPQNLDIVCFSHLRWDFVYQRPQHLISRFAPRHRIFFIEERIQGSGTATLGVTMRPCGVEVLVPQLPPDISCGDATAAQEKLVADHLASRQVANPLVWYYTPMAMLFARQLGASVVVYDCMDELSAFHGAPVGIEARERDLFAHVDLVFTGGRSLYHSKQQHHPRVYKFLSSVDSDHFTRARSRGVAVLNPRRLHVGYMGVVDERIDLSLIEGVARARPDWRLTVLGPVVKIDPSTLPRQPNILYTGLARYEDLPAHLAEWDVALIPFVRQAVTQYVSPTKLLEYFAAGLPVVSTSIPDVVNPYGATGLVRIADDTCAFVDAIEHAAGQDRVELRRRLDRVLVSTSWDRTWAAMTRLIEELLTQRSLPAASPPL